MPESDYQQEILKWRAERLARLTAEDGWTTLAGLYWLEPGDNSFGSADDNRIVTTGGKLPEHVGRFTLTNGKVRFSAAADAKVFHDGRPVQVSGPLVDDSAGAPTLLRIGNTSFHLIERSGRFGIRVRDSESPARLQFQGLEYLPADPKWRVSALFEPYSPARTITITTVLGMQESMTAPGALLFEVNGQACRLDAVIEPGERDWFLMFADQTNGKQSYGAGRFLYVTPPVDGKTIIDFNKSYSPPCSFSSFATCPLPPAQNHLPIAVTAGELKYAGGNH